MTLKTLLAALALSATAVSAVSAKQSDIYVTGIGYGHSKAHALQLSVAAWTVGAANYFDNANWNSATRGPIECFQMQPTTGITAMDSVPGGDVYTMGDPATAKWSCSVEATMRY